MIFRGMAAAAAATGLMLSGCANDGMLTTAAITPKPAQTAAAVDPACTTLAAQINTLRTEGTVERLEKAATGKGKSVQVKRDALAKQTELNKANADFQMKCGPKIPAATTAQAAPPPAETAATAATAAATQAATQQAQQAATKAAVSAATSAVKQP